MSEKETPTITTDRLRFTVTDVTKIVVFVASMLFQYFSFRSEIRENKIQQQAREDLITQRMNSAEDAIKSNALRVDFLYQSPALKPKPITIAPELDIP